jgi:hypothetical protein
MHMRDGAWTEAATDFFEVGAFEAGWEILRVSALPKQKATCICLGCRALSHACIEPPPHPTALQAFKSYDEAGVPRRVACLKYVVLAAMLMESAVDPFDAQEARSYKQASTWAYLPGCPLLAAA